MGNGNGGDSQVDAVQRHDLGLALAVLVRLELVVAEGAVAPERAVGGALRRFVQRSHQWDLTRVFVRPR